MSKALDQAVLDLQSAAAPLRELPAKIQAILDSKLDDSATVAAIQSVVTDLKSDSAAVDALVPPTATQPAPPAATGDASAPATTPDPGTAPAAS